VLLLLLLLLQYTHSQAVVFLLSSCLLGTWAAAPLLQCKLVVSMLLQRVQFQRTAAASGLHT
jgi:hypothetical protein